MSAKHTPGPWSVYDKDGSIGTIESASGIAVAQAQMVSRDDSNSGSKERLANSRLIAAAPELLKALQRVVMADEEQCLDDSDIAVARAAIAKATGEQA